MPHGFDGREGSWLIEVDGVRDEIVGCAGEERIARKDSIREVLDVVSYDNGGLGLHGSYDDMEIFWIAKIRNGDDVIMRLYTGLRKSSFHSDSGLLSFCDALLIALPDQNLLNGLLSFIQDGLGPANAEEVCFRKREDQVPLQRPRQHAGIRKGREAVGEHASDELCIEFSQIPEGGFALLISACFVIEQILGLDAPVSPDKCEVNDLVL